MWSSLTNESIPTLSEHLRTVIVPAMTFDTLAEGLERIDLLHLDTEGHDGAILAQVDLDRWSPGIIVYEHKHLALDMAAETSERLRRAGYTVQALSAENMLATKGLSPFRRR